MRADRAVHLAAITGHRFVADRPGGGNFYHAWMGWWFKRAVFDLHQSPMFVPFVNYPDGWHLTISEATPFQLATALPGTLFGNPVFGYNFALLVTFPLTAVAVYLWVKRIAGNRYAGFLAGTLFAFSPYRCAHMHGHLNLISTAFLPLYFWCLDDTLRAKSWCWRSIVTGAVLLGIIGNCSLYYLYMTLTLTAFYVVGYLLFVERASWRLPAFWGRLVALGMVALPLVAVAVFPYLQVVDRGTLERPPMELRGGSGSITDFFTPSVLHPLWGEWIADLFPGNYKPVQWMETTLYLGVATMALAFLARYVIPRNDPRRKNGRLFAWMALVCVILALGVCFKLFGMSIIVKALGPDGFIPMPGKLLADYLPFYDTMRVSMRYGCFALMFAAILAAYGATWLMERFKGRMRIGVGALLVAFVVFEFYPGIQPLAQLKARPLDA